MNIVAKHKEIKELFLKQQDEFKKVLGSDCNRFMRLALSYIASNQGVYNCSAQSLVKSVMFVAQTGLDLSPPKKHIYLVPFKSNCQVIISYLGYIELLYRYGAVINVQSNVVYKDDKFNYEYGLEQKLIHVPNLEIKQEDKNMTHAYCIVTLENREKTFSVMSKSEIEKRKKPYQSKFWVNWQAEMWKKTVIRNIVKYLNNSKQLINACSIDDDNTDINNNNLEEINNKPFQEDKATESLLTSLKQKIKDN